MERYEKSKSYLRRAEKVIPLGSQTFSKSRVHFPDGASPLFLTEGKGSRVWDVDGNEYVDFSGGLAALTLGYQDPDVDKAVLAQMAKGVSFSLPHTIEAEVAEKIVEMVPCAEMVRFGKNGSDVTAGAIRLARAYTQRDHVLVAGYHGWQDWYIGSTSRDLGVPAAVKALTHKFEYNNIASLERWFKQYPSDIAAVILEPMAGNGPKDGFLDKVKEMAHHYGALLIFDEVVTGFRMAKGGAQEVFGVIPDLCTLGKGLGNGYPISAIVGRADIMALMEEIFFSFTFGGETISLAAALAVLTKVQTQPVIETMARLGKDVFDGVNTLIKKYELNNVLSIGGSHVHNGLSIADGGNYSAYELRTLLLQEFFAGGVLSIGIHNMYYAHSDADVEKLLKTYDHAFSSVASTLAHNDLGQRLKGKVLEPLFAVRD